MKKLVFLLALLFAVMTLAVAVCADTMPPSAEPTPAGDGILTRVLVAVGIALVIAVIAVLIMVRGMSTVRPAKTADGYVKKNSFRLTESRDIYLYSRISRVRINNNKNK